jgi:hypothetical protein
VSFLKNRRQEDKTGPVWGVVSVGGGGYKETLWKGKYGENIMYSCIKVKTETY